MFSRLIHKKPVENFDIIANNPKPIDYEDIYLNTNERSKVVNFLKKILEDVTKVYGEQCIHGDKADLLKKIQIIKLLGTGTFGNVYSACAPQPCDEESYKFAIKLSSLLKKTHFKQPFDQTQQSWHEFLILRDYINPLLDKGICPNLPYMIEGYICNTCKFVDNSVRECIITLMELADGDLDNWFEEKERTEQEVYNALFQIMAGIHTIQYHCQLVNKDIKAPNILFYKVKPGGYWHYIIHGKDFYLPNLGYLFIINDFGVAFSVNPLTKLRQQKSNKWMTVNRAFMVINDKISPFTPTQIFTYKQKTYTLEKDNLNIYPKIRWYTDKIINGIPEINKISSENNVCRSFINLNGQIKDCNIIFTEEQKNILNKLNIPADSSDIKFYLYPKLIPDFNFSIDTQDCIRTFTGGQRVDIFPPQSHKKYKIPENVLNKILKYENKFIKGVNVAIYQFINPAFYVSGYFITDFFTKEYDLTKLPEGEKILDTYNISN